MNSTPDRPSHPDCPANSSTQADESRAQPGLPVRLKTAGTWLSVGVLGTVAVAANVVPRQASIRPDLPNSTERRHRPLTERQLEVGGVGGGGDGGAQCMAPNGVPMVNGQCPGGFDQSTGYQACPLENPPCCYPTCGGPPDLISYCTGSCITNYGAEGCGCYDTCYANPLDPCCTVIASSWQPINIVCGMSDPCAPGSCTSPSTWCFNPASGSGAACVPTLGCDPTSVQTDDGCTCCPSEGVVANVAGATSCTNCQTQQDLYSETCANDEPPASCGQCCASCLDGGDDGGAGDDGGDDGGPAFAVQPYIQWDEQLVDCVDPATHQPTAQRNPVPGPCGTITGDNETFVRTIADVVLKGDTWSRANVGDLTDFSGRSLPGCQFIGEFALIGLEKADLRKADFSQASFVAANLKGADLRWSNLRGAHLLGADMRPSTTSNPPQPTLLYLADLTGANLAMAHLDGAYLVRTVLAQVTAPSAVFDGAYIVGSDFTGAAMPNASFVGTTLSSVNGGGTEYRSTLAGSDLRLTDFRGARLGTNAGEGNNTDFSYAIFCDAVVQTDSFAQATTNGSFTRIPPDQATRNQGWLYVDPRRCTKLSPSTSVKFDERIGSELSLTDATGSLRPLFVYDWGNFPDWEENGPPRNDGTDPDFNWASPEFKLLDSGLLINIARPAGSDNLPERGIAYMLKLGSSFVVYTHAPFPNEGGRGYRIGGNGSGQTWWERRLVARGRGPMSVKPDIIADAYYYSNKNTQQLQNIAASFEAFYNGLSIIPLVGTIKIPIEAALLGKSIFSVENAVTVTWDMAALFTLGAGKLANPNSYRQLLALQSLRVGAAVTLAAGTSYQAYKAGTDIQAGNGIAAAFDVGGVVVGALLLRKSVKDFYQTKQLIKKFFDYSTVHFPTTPLALGADPEANKLSQRFAQWMAGRATDAQVQVAFALERGAITTADLDNVVATLRKLRYQKALDDAVKLGDQAAIDRATKWGDAITEPNYDPWGVNAQLAAQQQGARQAIGNVIQDRLGNQNTLVNKWTTLDGKTVDGVTLMGGDAAQAINTAKGGKFGGYSPLFVTGTATPANVSVIYQDALARWVKLLSGKFKSRDDALREFAQAVQAYYQGLPVNRGGDAIGRAMAAGVFRNAFGRTVTLPELVDANAYVLDQCKFVDYLMPFLKKALQ
jgi:uncharacterized protein YjbI with pentapeptide repeats